MPTLCGLSSSHPLEHDSFSSSSDEVRRKHNDSPLSLSPFQKYDDNYEWPNLFDEIDDMMELSILIWPMAELRQRYHEDKVDDPTGSIMKIPLPSKELAKVLEDNVRLFAKFTAERSDRPRNDVCMEMLDTIHFRKKNGARLETTQKFSIVHFQDELKNADFAYWLAVDHKQRRLTVTFSGSRSSSMDWVTASEIYMEEVRNPVGSHDSQSETVKLHSGLHENLFSPLSNGAKGSRYLSEYEYILRKHVLPVLKDNPGYKLYVTGHSLGAALATIFAFQAASEPDVVVPKPVTCVSIGSPYVGDESFRQAHQLLEGLGRLRHVRVTNHKDLVTIMPKMSFRWNVFDKSSHVGTPFKHVGMNLRMYPKEAPIDISFPKRKSGVFTGTLDELARAWDNSFLTNLSWNPSDMFTFPYHPSSEYNKRLTANRATLETLTLNDLYSRPDIVGNLIAES